MRAALHQMKKKGLVIEDDEHLVELLTYNVKDLGYELDSAHEGELGLAKAQLNDYAFILLDLNLPDIEGVEVCKRIRSEDRDVPIVVITARADDVSKVLLIEIGADDYLTKPFNHLELKARIKAILRRTERAPQEQIEDVFTFRELTIDFEKRRVSIGEKAVELTVREYEILRTLASCPGRPFSRSELSAAAYGYDVSGYGKSISSHINRLRAKIEPDPENPQYLLTVRGVGYCLSDAG